MKKFELTTDTKMCLGKRLFRVKALVSFGAELMRVHFEGLEVPGGDEDGEA